jgi:hypothetical protein
MNYYNESLLKKVMYFNVTVNGKRNMVSMQVNDDGSLRYIPRYIEDKTID